MDLCTGSKIHKGRMMRLLALACLITAVAGKGAFEGTDKNFEKDVLNSGKNAFVKFLAPW